MASKLMVAAVVAVLGASSCTVPCGPGGTGTLIVVFEGLPAGVSSSATLSGPSGQTVTSGQTLRSVGSGDWTVTAEKAVQADPRVRTAYAPTLSRASFCLSSGGSETITITWAPIATSNKLWTSNGSGGTGSLLGFASSLMAATGSTPASVSAKTPGGGGVAFDKDGNLWAVGGTTADPTLVRFSAGVMNSSGDKTPDRKIVISDINCLPRVSGIAFDPAGNLFVASPCRKNIYQLKADQLTSSATVTALVYASNVVGVTGLAVDSAGALWAASADAQRIRRFLPSSGAGLDGNHVSVRATENPADTSLMTPSWLAFDAAGNLWATDFGANVVFKVAKEHLTVTGPVEVMTTVRITLGVTALLEGLAVDESGGLWLPYSTGKLARLAPAQLTVSTGAGAPTTPETIISSTDLAYAGNVAFYPAPAATPLYHRLP